MKCQPYNKNRFTIRTKLRRNAICLISTHLLIMKVVNGKRTFGYDEPIIYKRV